MFPNPISYTIYRQIIPVISEYHPLSGRTFITMGSQWGYDRTYIRAKHEGYRSRAAYKLLEIQRKYAIIRPDDNIVDLGAAPGSWLQVERTLTDAKVVGIDLNPIAHLDGVETIEGDLNDPDVQEKVRSLLGVVNVVVCDAAPKLSGHKSYDQARIIELNEQALKFACNVLKQGGNFVVKSFQGTDFPELYSMTKEQFYSVKTCITRSTRKGSTELYIIAKNFKG
jgi:23S rRNA (uridine2552-2'-O)-methyltransferase